MGRRRSGRDPLKLFITTTWHNINRRTVNGSYPDLKSTSTKAYIEHGTKLEFTQQEFIDWCQKQKDKILSLQRPSIDRIDSWGNYTLDNIQIIPFEENCRQGGEIKQLRTTERMERLFLKYCPVCNLRLTRKQTRSGKWEPTPAFKKRLTCGKECSMVLRKRDEKGRMV